MVFIKPTIMRDVNDIRSITTKKYDFMRAEQIMKSGDKQLSKDKILSDFFNKNISQ